MEIPQITAHAKRLRELKDYKDELESKLKEVNSEARNIQEKLLPRLMEDAEIEKYTVAGVGTLYIKNELFVSCVTDEDGHKPFMDWARDNAPDLISETIHHQRLKSWSKERLEQGQPLPDNMIKATFVPTAMIKRS